MGADKMGVNFEKAGGMNLHVTPEMEAALGELEVQARMLGQAIMESPVVQGSVYAVGKLGEFGGGFLARTRVGRTIPLLAALSPMVMAFGGGMDELATSRFKAELAGGAKNQSTLMVEMPKRQGTGTPVDGVTSDFGLGKLNRVVTLAGDNPLSDYYASAFEGQYGSGTIKDVNAIAIFGSGSRESSLDSEKVFHSDDIEIPGYRTVGLVEGNDGKKYLMGAPSKGYLTGSQPGVDTQVMTTELVFQDGQWGVVANGGFVGLFKDMAGNPDVASVQEASFKTSVLGSGEPGSASISTATVVPNIEGSDLTATPGEQGGGSVETVDNGLKPSYETPMMEVVRDGVIVRTKVITDGTLDPGIRNIRINDHYENAEGLKSEDAIGDFVTHAFYKIWETNGNTGTYEEFMAKWSTAQASGKPEDWKQVELKIRTNDLSTEIYDATEKTVWPMWVDRGIPVPAGVTTISEIDFAFMKVKDSNKDKLMKIGIEGTSGTTGYGVAITPDGIMYGYIGITTGGPNAGTVLGVAWEMSMWPVFASRGVVGTSYNNPDFLDIIATKVGNYAYKSAFQVFGPGDSRVPLEKQNNP